MRLTSKCLVVALSALFAATPVAPVGAVPLPTVKVQPVEGGTDVQLVRDYRWYLRRHRYRGDFGGPIRGRKEWYGDRAQRHWRGDRDGWYRGHRGYRHARRGYRYHDGFWFPLAAFGAGAIIGGAIANDRGYVGGGSHVNWCANRYRSYRAYDNTYQPYNGPRRQCLSPYR